MVMSGSCPQVALLVVVACGVAAARREEAGRVFLKGGDVSLLARIEGLGGVYREGGEAREALAIFRGHGWNCVRLRLVHSTSGATRFPPSRPSMSDGGAVSVPRTLPVSPAPAFARAMADRPRGVRAVSSHRSPQRTPSRDPLPWRGLWSAAA